MSPILVAVMVAVFMMAGALVGSFLRKNLPSHHFDEESQDVVKLGLGFLATLSALVMGLVVSSSKASYDAKAEMIHTSAALIIQLDSNLRGIGPEADPARQLLKNAVESTMDQLWGNKRVNSGSLSDTNKRELGQLQKMLFSLSAKSELQREAQANALKALSELARLNAVAFTQQGSDVMTPLLVVVSCWMMITVLGWNLFAPCNRMVMAVNVVCSLSVASAIFLILEMDQPFNGVVEISDAAMRAALFKLSE